MLFYRIMGHDWDRTAAQFEKARGRIRIRKRPVVSAEWRLQKRQAIMSDILDNARDESEEARLQQPQQQRRTPAERMRESSG